MVSIIIYLVFANFSRYIYKHDFFKVNECSYDFIVILYFKYESSTKTISLLGERDQCTKTLAQ